MGAKVYTIKLAKKVETQQFNSMKKITKKLNLLQKN